MWHCWPPSWGNSVPSSSGTHVRLFVSISLCHHVTYPAFKCWEFLSIWSLCPLSVCLGCPIKVPTGLGSFNNRHLSSHTSGSQKSEMSLGLVLLNVLPWLGDGLLLTVSSHGLICCYKDTSYIGLAPTLWPHFTFIICLKGPSPNTVTFGGIRGEGPDIRI